MTRAHVELAFCVVFTVMAALTAVWPTWIEGLVGLEPDGGDGSAEWGVLVAFALIALTSGLLARRDHRLAVLRSVAAAAKPSEPLVPRSDR